MIPTIIQKKTHTSSPVDWRRIVSIILVIILLISTSGYASIAVSQRTNSGTSPSLDAMRFAEFHPQEYEAIQWLDEQKGTPTLVSAPGINRFRWNASYATAFTGIPTVVGQDSEALYRGESVYNERVNDVDTIYNGSTSERVRLLSKYAADLIYVGPPERQRYGSVRSFEELSGVTIAFQNDVVTIYRVDQAQLETN
jgi:uncharacterized membrane protein